MLVRRAASGKVIKFAPERPGIDHVKNRQRMRLPRPRKVSRGVTHHLSLRLVCPNDRRGSTGSERAGTDDGDWDILVGRSLSAGAKSIKSTLAANLNATCSDL